MLAPLKMNISSGEYFYSPTLMFEELQHVDKQRLPVLEPYEGLCKFWDNRISAWINGYPAFLHDFARNQGVLLRSILDLACGTGILAKRLSFVAEHVVGLDSSEPMLEIARKRCANRINIQFKIGAFLNFQLNQTFDAITCTSNSINYLANIDELSELFRRVSNHLNPGGVFVFDTLTERGMQLSVGYYTHITASQNRYAMKNEGIDNDRRKFTTVLLPVGIEVHYQIPIGLDDVEKAIRGTDLRVEDAFSSTFIPPWLRDDGFCIFVLTKAE